MNLHLHTVAPGETLHGIARKFAVKPAHLKTLNGLRSAQLSEGQTLLVRVLPEEADFPSSRDLTGGFMTYTVKSGDNLFRLSIQFHTTAQAIKALNGLSSDALSVGQVLQIPGGQSPIVVPSVPAQQTQTYQVRAGDTLFGIARKFNTTVVSIKLINHLGGDGLSIGQQLTISVQASGVSFPIPPAPQPPRPQPPFQQPPVNPPPFVTPNPIPVAAAGISEDSAKVFINLTLLNGQPFQAALRKNNPLGINPKGVQYGGKSTIFIPTQQLQMLGIDEVRNQALQFCKKIEGNYDAINTYDNGIFSYGFIQFTGQSGSLDRLLQSMQDHAPEKFNRTFRQAGISVSANKVQVQDAQGNFLTGPDAWKFIRGQYSLLTPFIQAGFDADLVFEQYRQANLLYVQPALSAQLSLNFDGGSVKVPLTVVLPAAQTQALAVSLWVNLGSSPSGAPAYLSRVLSSFAQQRGISDPSGLARVPWNEVSLFISNFQDTLLAKSKNDLAVLRAKEILASGLA
jgi:LysM repeat protein